MQAQSERTPTRRPWMSRVALMIAPAAILLALFGIVAFQGQPRGLGKPAPAFELERLDGGGTISSHEFRARPYVLNFWASWCIPCREEAPALRAVVGSGLSDVGFLGVNILDGREEARGFVKEFGVGYPNASDDGRTYRTFGVTGVPETIFVDRRGVIVGRFVGAIDEAELRRLLTELQALRPGEALDISRSGRSVGVS